ncbi:TIM barrel protein [Flavobacteriaceae bacterium]|jgi:hydroxypyruvate isomerase|nr:TIM barrel protein [Flavobacteriaceae bacterium]|tara:strand:- start:4449 stop:5369 length:921 start_codon:yes stop_codon:yes gene_type:complete
MKRRNFIRNSSLVSAGLLSVNSNFSNYNELKSKHNFNLQYAPHLGMFKNHAGDNPIDQLQFMIDQGFTAFEDNNMRKRELGTQKKMASFMLKNNMKMGVFVAHTIYWKEPNLASGNKKMRNEFLNEIKESVDVAKRVNAKWITVVPGHLDLKLNIGYQTSNVIESLKFACDILEPHGITMVLEPLNFKNHPGLFLSKSPQAYEICKSVDSNSCKILFDIYHQQIEEGNLIPNIEACWDEIAYFQIGDNPGRKEPTTGEINYKNIFKYIHNKGFNGILGMEHGNSIPNKKGEKALIDAYKKTDNFLI